MLKALFFEMRQPCQMANILYRSGDLDIRIPLRTTVYLPYETEYVPWAAVSSELGFVSLMLQRDSLYGEWKVRNRDLVFLCSVSTVGFASFLKAE